MDTGYDSDEIETRAFAWDTQHWWAEIRRLRLALKQANEKVRRLESLRGPPASVSPRENKPAAVPSRPALGLGALADALNKSRAALPPIKLPEPVQFPKLADPLAGFGTALQKSIDASRTAFESPKWESIFRSAFDDLQSSKSVNAFHTYLNDVHAKAARSAQALADQQETISRMLASFELEQEQWRKNCAKMLAALESPQFAGHKTPGKRGE